MARPKKTPPEPPALPPDEALAAATLALVAERGWRRLTLEDAVAAAGIGVVEAAGLCSRKTDLLALVVRSIDREMVAHARPEPEESARDRLFEVLMARFDALQARREPMTALVRETLRDPLLVARLARPVEGAMHWALKTAGLDTRGLRGLVRTRVMGLLYLAVLRVWLEDDSPDMARTMKALDQRLAQAEELANTFEGGRRGRRDAEGAAHPREPPETPSEP